MKGQESFKQSIIGVEQIDLKTHVVYTIHIRTCKTWLLKKEKENILPSLQGNIKALMVQAFDGIDLSVNSVDVFTETTLQPVQ